MTLNYTAVAGFAAALFIVYILMWIFVKPVKFLLKSAFGGVLGSVALFACNMLTAPLGFSVGINIYTAAVCAFLGVPGFLLILISKMMFT